MNLQKEALVQDSRKKNLLVVGGSYFAGRVFVEHMADKSDYAVYALNRGNRPLNMPQVTELVADRNDPQALSRALAGLSWDGVVDFCGYTAAEVGGLIDQIDPAGSASDARYVFISTISVFADTRALPLVETSPVLTAPVPELGPAAEYGFLKQQAEAAVIAHCRARGPAWTILRPAIIFGPYNYAPRESYFFNLILDEEMLIIPRETPALFQFVSVRDLAAIIHVCLENEATRDNDYNLAAPELISYARYVEVLEEITGRRLPVMTMAAAEIEARKIPLPFPLESHIIASSEKLIRHTGFRFAPFVEEMAHTWRWFAGEGRIL